jgi:Iron-sulfur cluster-binding domain
MPTLEITTHLGCALACRFCPQQRLVKAYPKDAPRDLTLADFVRIIAALPPHVRIDFSGMAEPWLNPDATAMVVYAFERRRLVAIYTTLQGLSPDAAALLIDRYGARITPETPWVIHLPDAAGHMRGWKPSAAYRETLRRFIDFRRARAPAGLSFMTMSRDGIVAASIRDLLPDPLDPFVGVSRAENLDRTDIAPAALLAAVRHEGAAVLCRSTPFFDHNTLLPNGDVLLCCMDYGRAHVLGNLLRQSWAEIHAGPAIGAVRVQAMSPSAVGSLLCRRCHHAARLRLDGETHWKLLDPTFWSRPRDTAPGLL